MKVDHFGNTIEVTPSEVHGLEWLLARFCARREHTTEKPLAIVKEGALREYLGLKVKLV